MNYNRGNDIVSALKFFYQNKYGVPTEVLAECRSIPEVICASEKLQLPQSDSAAMAGSGVDVINALGSYYGEKKVSRDDSPKFSNKQSKKENKRERFEEPKVQEETPVEVVNSLVDSEIKMEEDHA